MRDAATIRWIFWDNDGVLVDTERLYFQANREILRTEGIDLSLERHHRLSFANNFGVWPLLRERGYDESRIAALRQARNHRYAELIRIGKIEIPGVREVLIRLHGRVQMAIVTSSLREHFDHIHARTGYLDKMTFILTREDYQHSKPDPEPYLKALERADADPRECLAVEDSQRGLQSAKEAGLTCWVIPTTLTAGGDFSRADRILNAVTEIPTFLDP